MPARSWSDLHNTAWDGHYTATKVLAHPAYVPAAPPTPDYYATHTFRIEDAADGGRWLGKLGPQHRAALTSLELHVGAQYEIEQKAWRRLFLFLAEPTHLPSLRHLKVSWEAEITTDDSDNLWAWEDAEILPDRWDREERQDALFEAVVASLLRAGGGRDLVAIRALGRMRRLESVVLAGHCMADWVPYLWDQGVKVRFDDWAGKDRIEFQRQFPPPARPHEPCEEEAEARNDLAAVGLWCVGGCRVGCRKHNKESWIASTLELFG